MRLSWGEFPPGLVTTVVVWELMPAEHSPIPTRTAVLKNPCSEPEGSGKPWSFVRLFFHCFWENAVCFNLLTNLGSLKRSLPTSLKSLLAYFMSKELIVSSAISLLVSNTTLLALTISTLLLWMMSRTFKTGISASGLSAKPCLIKSAQRQAKGFRINYAESNLWLYPLSLVRSLRQTGLV